MLVLPAAEVCLGALGRGGAGAASGASTSACRGPPDGQLQRRLSERCISCSCSPHAARGRARAGPTTPRNPDVIAEPRAVALWRHSLALTRRTCMSTSRSKAGMPRVGRVHRSTGFSVVQTGEGGFLRLVLRRDMREVDQSRMVSAAWEVANCSWPLQYVQVYCTCGPCSMQVHAGSISWATSQHAVTLASTRPLSHSCWSAGWVQMSQIAVCKDVALRSAVQAAAGVAAQLVRWVPLC